MNDLVGAEAAYEAALSYDDTLGHWHGRLGLVRRRLKGWVAATSAYEAALQREPKNDIYRYALGLAGMFPVIGAWRLRMRLDRALF